jgi:hypothetical protein
LFNILEQLKKYPISDLYRFFIDGKMHSFENGWGEYALREKGCLTGLFDAFTYIISTNMEDPNISVDLLNNIHKRITQTIVFEEKNMIEPGKLRSEYTCFLLLPDKKKSGFCNQEGLNELINFVKEYKNENCGIIHLENHWYDCESTEDYNNWIKKMENSKDESTNVSYETLDNKQLYFRPPQPKNLQSLLIQLCQNYNNSIKKAKNQEEKLEIIIKTIKKHELIHSRYDGNGRTSLILLQRLLIQNGFLPTLMENPNHIDGHDLNSLIEEIKQGMKYTQALIDDPNAIIFNYKTKKLTREDFFGKHDIDYWRSNNISLKNIIEEYYKEEKKLGNFIKFGTQNNSNTLINTDEEKTFMKTSVQVTFFNEKDTLLKKEDDEKNLTSSNEGIFKDCCLIM